MDLKRTGALLGLAALTTVGLAACSDNNAGSGDQAAQQVADAECGGKAALKASGASSQNNAMTVFANSYAMSCEGQTLDYTSNGSGAGGKEFIGGQTDFGGSDSPLKDEEYTQAEQRCEGPAWNLPAVFGPIAIAYNLDGVEVARSAHRHRLDAEGRQHARVLAHVALQGEHPDAHGHRGPPPVIIRRTGGAGVTCRAPRVHTSPSSPTPDDATRRSRRQSRRRAVTIRARRAGAGPADRRR